MEIIHHHILPFLEKLIHSEKDDEFNDLYDNLQNEYKSKYKDVLKYVNTILKLNIDSSEELGVMHIHFEKEQDENFKILLFEFLAIWIFKCYENSCDEESVGEPVLNIVEKLKSKLNRLENNCPVGASAQRRNRIYLNWLNDKRSCYKLLSFYKILEQSSNISPKGLINCQVGRQTSVQDLFLNRPFICFDDNLDSYVIGNTDKSLNDLDRINSEIIENVETILLYDCESKRIMQNYSLNDILEWNENGTNISKLILVTFGRDNLSIQNIKSKLELIKQRFKIPTESSYTILESEFLSLVNEENNVTFPICFVGINDSTFWNSFLIETSIRELYELQSIKMKNLYSIVFNEEIKNFILDDLFSSKETSIFLSDVTKESLLAMNQEDTVSLQTMLGAFLDSLIRSNTLEKIKKHVKKNTEIIISDFVLKEEKLRAKVLSALEIDESFNLKSWLNIDIKTNKPLVIISYRDVGNFPYYFYPNILELGMINSTDVKAFYQTCLFKNQFDWSKYFLAREYYKNLSHYIRFNYCSWNKLANEIEFLKPKKISEVNWILEHEYSNSDNRETYKIKYKDVRRPKVFSISDYFIIKEKSIQHYKVDRLDNLIKYNLGEEAICIQSLEEIQENINLFEKIIDTEQQEAELKIIKSQFGIEDRDPGRLWKILLKNQSIASGDERLYTELQTTLKLKNLKIVSFNHFKNTWLNPESTSLAPINKKVFITVCDFLKLPKAYVIILQRIRNASKQSSRQSTRQMNQLLKDLFNDGCFDNDKNALEIINNRIEQYKVNHPLDELGIDEKYLVDNLVSLVELIKPELKLVEIETVEKVSNE